MLRSAGAGIGRLGRAGGLEPTPEPPPTRKKKPAAPAETVPTLFDDPRVTAAPAPDRAAASSGDQASTLGAQVVASETFGVQWERHPRLAITHEQVAALVDALASARGNRLPSAGVALVLNHPASRIAGPVGQARQLLNVEGYNVLGQAPDGQVVILDVSLLQEQFGLP